MQVYDIITKKKRNIPLTSGEIEWLVKSYTDGEISDAQMTAFLMAVYFNSMTDEETSAMTMAMGLRNQLWCGREFPFYRQG